MEERPDMTGIESDLLVEIERLAERLLGREDGRRAEFVARVMDRYNKAKGKEFLLIHNPGGWGNTRLELCLDWERSIVFGVADTMEELGRTWSLTQYFRSGNSFWHHMRDVGKEARFFFKSRSRQAEMMAEELGLLTQRLPDLRVVLIGASQGAAFGNAVMRELGEHSRVYSIELGIFFPHMSHRVVTERTLAIDTNGLMPDPMAHRNLKAAFKAYLLAFLRWFRGRIQGKPVKFTHCINVPGHEYRWEYPGVQGKISEFLRANFGRS